MAKVTAGRDELGAFAPKFAELNDDVLFGQVWSREDKLSARDRSIVTLTALMASGILDSSLKFHLQNAKNHGVMQEEIAEILTHAAFYVGWPKAWAAFHMAKEVWEKRKEDEWDKVFTKSDKVNHCKVTFHNRYGITLAADLYEPKHVTGKLPAIAVCGPFGAVKEQASGLYAQTMAERGLRLQ